MKESKELTSAPNVSIMDEEGEENILGLNGIGESFKNGKVIG